MPMATPSEKLASSLEELKRLQDRGQIAIRSGELSRTHRQRLLKHGFIQEVMKGWYIPVRPDETAGESTAWYASFWKFCASYLEERFGRDWCLSPEQSISVHADNWTVPAQLLVRSSAGQNNLVSLPFSTSLLGVKAAMPPGADMLQKYWPCRHCSRSAPDHESGWL